MLQEMTTLITLLYYIPPLLTISKVLPQMIQEWNNLPLTVTNSVLTFSLSLKQEL